MKFKIGDRVRGIFHDDLVGTIIDVAGCPLGRDCTVSWDDGSSSVGYLDHHIALFVWDDFQERIRDRIK